ncbi:MAG: type II toxin-antitoxin system VapC family toxin [Dermatophilaceae bacterium]
MIVDASVVIDAVCDPGARGEAARDALAEQPPSEPLIAPGLLAVEVMSGLRAAANRPGHPFDADEIPLALQEAEAYGIHLEATPWSDVRRAWELSRSSLRYANGVYVAAAERHRTPLLTADARIDRSGAPLRCVVLTVTVPERPG